MKNLTKFLLIALLVGGASAVKAQSAKFNPADSSVTYLKNKFVVGQEVQLFYGSGADKNFAFVEADNFTSMKEDKLPSSDSKLKFKIKEMMVNGDGKVILKGKASWTENPDDVIVVDIEGAIDNKEIVAPDNLLAPTPVKKVTKNTNEF